jgi:hypothetical protein
MLTMIYCKYFYNFHFYLFIIYIEGKLKWGVGKLIAHCPTTPIVIPFYHFGTENTYPQHIDTKIIKNTIPYLGLYY